MTILLHNSLPQLSGIQDSTTSQYHNSDLCFLQKKKKKKRCFSTLHTKIYYKGFPIMLGI